MYKVYMWKNKITNKKYIGTTKQKSVYCRAGKDGYGYHGSPYFYSAIQKYGFDNFLLSILKDHLTKQLASVLLKFYIKKYNTMDKEAGYNLHLGGFPSVLHIDTKRALRISNTLKIQRSSPQYRKIMSDRMKKVWDNPVKRLLLLKKRAGKPSGRPAKRVFCTELNKLFSSFALVLRLLGFSRSLLSLRFSKHCAIKIKSHIDNKEYTLSLLK